jgi:hypothetical protein
LFGVRGDSVTDDRLAWEDHTLDTEQLDLFADEPETPGGPGAYDEPAAERDYQLTELPGETFEDIFGDAA